MNEKKIARDPSALTSEVRGRLIDAIMTGELKPGDRLILDKLAERLGVSRTPVRDALLRLVSEGIVEPADRRGYVIRELTASEIDNNFDSRLAIEAHAAARLAQRGGEALTKVRAVLAEVSAQSNGSAVSFYEANRKVHRAIVEAAGNPQLLVFFDAIWGQAVSNQVYLSFFRAESDKSFESDHLALIEVLAAGDPEAAREALIRHIGAGREQSRAPQDP
jgi:DNA-binding GntR family transcriptional regulator